MIVGNEVVVGVVVIWHEVAALMIVTFQLDLARIDCIFRQQEILTIELNPDFMLIMLSCGYLRIIFAQLLSVNIWLLM